MSMRKLLEASITFTMFTLIVIAVAILTPLCWILEFRGRKPISHLLILITVAYTFRDSKGPCTTHRFYDKYREEYVPYKVCGTSKKIKKTFTERESAVEFLNGFSESNIPQFGHDLKPIRRKYYITFGSDHIYFNDLVVTENGKTIYKEGDSFKDIPQRF